MDELLFCDYFDRIVGQPIDYIGRVMDLLNIGIGDSVEVLDRKGRTVKKVPILCIFNQLGEL
ncbi:MAG: hypothetical protein K2H91_11685 [Lachnospiraceae bacterium]|nr:hypothetical protein [Lachnospiraceae bacterium]